MANEVTVKKEETFSVALTNMLTESKDALPTDLNITRFVTNAVALLNGNEMLAKFAQTYGSGQIKAGLMRGAVLGLDALSKEYYLIPYSNKLEFMMDYRGAEKLVKKYSVKPVRSIVSNVVRAGDEFSLIDNGGKSSYRFVPIPFNDGAIIGAFAACIFTDGDMTIDMMSIKELENTRKHSKASNSMAWKDFAGEMYKKTVLHRLCKHIQIDFPSPNQREAWDDDVAINTKEEKTVEVVNPFDEVKADAIEVVAEEVTENAE